MVRYGVPALVLAFLLVGVLAPLVRLYLRHGVFGFVGHRASDPVAAAIAASFLALVAGGSAWAAALAVLGPDLLGVAALPPAVHAAGLAMMVAGIVLCAAAQAQMGASWRIGVGDQPTELVRGGLYRWSRHPIYSALAVYALGVVLAAPSWPTAAGVALVLAAISAEARLEERHLLRVHGEAYRAYGQAVGRFVPWLGRFGAR
jgi:protein-S-isoprenylcysteine O-methyltransferase Ste14